MEAIGLVTDFFNFYFPYLMAAQGQYIPFFPKPVSPASEILWNISPTPPPQISDNLQLTSI
jgi:hypothetical protein